MNKEEYFHRQGKIHKFNRCLKIMRILIFILFIENINFLLSNKCILIELFLKKLKITIYMDLIKKIV